jgi:hypothetical protein
VELLLQRLQTCQLEGSLGVRRVLQARMLDWMHIRQQQQQQQQQQQLDDTMQQRLQEVESFLRDGRPNGEEGGAGWRQVEDTSSGRIWYINVALGAIREHRTPAAASSSLPCTGTAAAATAAAAAITGACVGLIQLQLLPGGSGALSSDTLILFFQPSHHCDVPTCHALFIECVLFFLGFVPKLPCNSLLFTAGLTWRLSASWAADLQP